MEINIINGPRLRTMILTGARKLEIEKAKIDSLNVFPVPDGDTGTNMSLTMASAVKALNNLPGENLKDVAKAIAHGALMGARGNSGVILSQILGGWVKVIENEDKLDAILLSKAFTQGVESAYKAVVKPVEGTILTVAREAAEKLAENVTTEMGIEEALQIFLQQGYKTLALTPEMLPVLKQANVVDAGGQGFLTIVEGMILGLQGEDIESIEINENKFDTSASLPIMDFDLKEDDIQFQYCTEMILKPKNGLDVSHADIRNYLEEKGDCVLVVGSEAIIKIHVHTNHPGLVLEYCGDLGSLHDIKIENMAEQNQNLKTIIPKKNIGIISVSLGEGLNEIFRSLGVDIVITGGQTMNPSTEDIVNAIDRLEAEQVIILPNNKNIILAAEQAIKLANKPAFVVPTKTIPQGIGALMAFNSELELNTNLEKMEASIDEIKTGEVTYAVRDAKHGDFDIKEGQILGIVQGEVSLVHSDLDQGVIKLMEDLLDEDSELVTLYYGQNIDKDQAEDLLDKLSSMYTSIDFELHYSGHPLYYYLISVE
ncbi:MAG: DAK2 domain-containing protein [Clostridia bacterium]|nr:DAK2 domain-containing protein [Clostridia bacterium]